MNQLLIYSKVWFTVVDNRPASPCQQMSNFWNFRTLDEALKKLDELWRNYYTRDYSSSYPENLEPLYYGSPMD